MCEQTTEPMNVEERTDRKFVQCKTAIIGAGFAGLTAAVNFLHHDYEDFLVLEAHDRIGGRCFTIDHENGYLEYGAEFSETQLSHPLFDLIKQGKWDENFEELVKSEPIGPGRQHRGRVDADEKSTWKKAKEDKDSQDKQSESKSESWKDDKELVDFSGIDLNITKEEFENEDKCRQCFMNQNGKRINLKLAHVLFQLIDQAIQKAIAESKCSDKKCEGGAEDSRPPSQECNIGDSLYKSYLSLVQAKFGVDFNEAPSKPETETQVDVPSLEWQGISLSLVEFKKIVDGVFLWRWKWENIEKGCVNLSDVFARHFGAKSTTKQSKKEKSETEAAKKFSYKDILDQLIEKSKTKFYERLRLNHSVKKIILCEKWNPEQSSAKPMESCWHCKLTDEHEKVILLVEKLSGAAENAECPAKSDECPTESCEKKANEYFVLCDNVICTMSLGYLKENLDELFVPSRFISSEKRESIERLGYATYNKVFLTYEKPFWNENFQGLHLIWEPEESELSLNITDTDQINKAHSQHADPNECDWVRDISSFKLAKSQKNVLYATLGNSECFEKLDDKFIMQECTKLLRRFMGREDIPEPVSIMRYKWHTDPYIRGAYSYMPLDSSPTDITNIAEPIEFNNVPLVLFSGEATDTESFSTVLGAFVTGVRESNRVLKAFNASTPAAMSTEQESCETTAIGEGRGKASVSATPMKQGCLHEE